MQTDLEDTIYPAPAVPAPATKLPVPATREQLERKRARRYSLLWLPAAEMWVRLQSLTEREKTAYEALPFDEKGKWDIDLAEARIRELNVRVLVDAEGKRLYTDDDAPLLAEHDGGDMSLLFDAARQHCGFNHTIEAAKKN